jgi:hypothetical protein
MNQGNTHTSDIGNVTCGSDDFLLWGDEKCEF